jgi:diacylglycerol kinase
MLSLKQLRNSFRFAIAGMARVFKEEQNFRVQVVVAIMVLCVMFIYDMGTLERAVLTLAIAMVLVLELMNSIFERVVDLLKPRVHQHVKEVKDVMAATVLVAAFMAAVVGLLIIGPYISKSLFG